MNDASRSELPSERPLVRDNRAIVRERFGEHAASYVTSPSHAKGWSLAKLVELIQPAPGWRALDIGTGAGHTALAFAPHVAEVVATDITPEMLQATERLAAERHTTNLRTQQADAMHLPLADDSFDLVTCRLAAHHFPDVPAFVHEVARVLRPGGRLGLVDNVVPDDDAAADFVNAFERLRDPGHEQCLSLESWSAHLARAGLAIEHVEARPKPVLLRPWADAQGLDEPTREELRARLVDPPDAARAFLRPRPDKGDMEFELREALVVAQLRSDAS